MCLDFGLAFGKKRLRNPATQANKLKKVNIIFDLPELGGFFGFIDWSN